MPNTGLNPSIENQMANSYFTFVRRFGRAPTWKDIQDDVRNWMERTPIDDAVDESGRYINPTRYIQEYSVPSQTTINNRMRDYKNRIPDAVLDGSHIDSQWSLGASDWSQLPPEASGVLMQMWKYSLTNPDALGFTIRQAQWVNKVRWIPEAGGSSNGQILNERLMYQVSSAYAARERFSEDSKQKRRSTAPLDASLMLNPNVVRLAIQAGHTELNEESNTWLSDLGRYNPKFLNLTKTIDHINRDVRKGFNNSIKEMKELSKAFHQLDGTGKALEIATDMLHFGLEIARKDPRFQQTLNFDFGDLFNIQIDPELYTEAVEQVDKIQGLLVATMFMEIYNAFLHNTQDSWTPNLDDLNDVFLKDQSIKKPKI